MYSWFVETNPGSLARLFERFFGWELLSSFVCSFSSFCFLHKIFAAIFFSHRSLEISTAEEEEEEEEEAEKGKKIRR